MNKEWKSGDIVPTCCVEIIDKRGLKVTESIHSLVWGLDMGMEGQGQGRGKGHRKGQGNYFGS